MTWLQEFLNSTSELESPRSYFYWSMLTTISAVMGKKVWISRGGVYNLYPNIYTFLISKKSGLRKGIPINIAKKLTHDLGQIRVIDGQNSIQGVLKELSQVRTLGEGYVIKDAVGFLITGEFASFMLTDGVGFSLTTLTDLYDAQYHEHGFKKTLASQDPIELKNLCLTALFASNEVHFFDSVPSNAISGGFLARTFCIYEERRNKINSLSGQRDPIPDKINYSRILDVLLSLSHMTGEMIAEPHALRAFDDWYYPFSGEGKENTENSHNDQTGTSERLGDNIWKAAMLISLANDHDMIVLEDDMREAIEKSVETFTNLRRLLIGGATDNKSIQSLTMRTTVACILETAPTYEIERKKILIRGAGVFGVYDLDACVEHLLQAGMIMVSKRGQNIYYKLTPLMIRRHIEIKDKGKSVGGTN